MLFSRFSPSFSFTGSISQDLWLWQIWKSVKMCCTVWEVGPERLPEEGGPPEAAPTMDTGQLMGMGCYRKALAGLQLP